MYYFLSNNKYFFVHKPLEGRKNYNLIDFKHNLRNNLDNRLIKYYSKLF